MSSTTNTGVKFRGHPVLLGPRTSDGRLPDRLILTSLDRFLKRHFPELSSTVEYGEPIVIGA
ncbi:MAG: hypothetical protein V3T88_02920, partial [Nitrosomonadaceae bacterium]